TKGRPLDDGADLLGDVHGALERNLRNENRELLAAYAREDVLATELGAHDRRELAQNGVAREVPEGVVLLLEVIDVEQDERELAAVAPAARNLALQCLVEVALVEDLRETIERHHSIDL